MVTCPNASFTDLAEIVSRIEPVKQALMDGKWEREIERMLKRPSGIRGAF